MIRAPALFAGATALGRTASIAAATGAGLLGAAYRRIRYTPFLTQLIVTRRCNLSCGYCHEYDQVSSPVSTELLRERIDQVGRLGSLGLELTGGEPLLQPDLVSLVAHARRYPFHMLGLITNGFLLTPAIVDGLNQAGLTDLQISVDGVEPNPLTRKTLRPLREKLEMLGARGRFKKVLCAVVGSGTSEDEVAEVIRFARQHGFRPRILLVHDALGQLALGPEALRPYHRVQKMIGWHHHDFFDYRPRLMLKGEAPFRCRAGSRYLYVDEEGLVRWCAQTREGPFGKPLRSYTEEDLRHQYRVFKPCNRSCTLGCVRSCSMFDELFAQPLAA